MDANELRRWLWSPNGRQFPLVFEAKAAIPFLDSRLANSFVQLNLHGRQIATFHESQEMVCIDGVNPGSVVSHGKTIEDAQNRFSEEVSCVLSDIESSCDNSPDAFIKEVSDFMEQTDGSLADTWMKLTEALLLGQDREQAQDQARAPVLREQDLGYDNIVDLMDWLKNNQEQPILGAKGARSASG